MTIAIVQIGTYVFPLVGPSPSDPAPTANVVMPGNPTAGNILIAGVPNNYVDEGIGVTVNPYWSMFLAQHFVFTTHNPDDVWMTWLYHVVESGEVANLPPFYDGWSWPSGTLSGYQGAIVYELSGASHDLTVVPNSINALSDEAGFTGFASIASVPITTDAPGCLTIGYATSTTLEADTPPPWCGTALGAPVVADMYGNPTLSAEDLAPIDWAAGHQFVTSPSSVTDYGASFPNINSILSLMSVISIKPASASPPTSGAFLELSVATVNWTRPWTE